MNKNTILFELKINNKNINYYRNKNLYYQHKYYY